MTETEEFKRLVDAGPAGKILERLYAGAAIAMADGKGKLYAQLAQAARERYVAEFKPSAEQLEAFDNVLVWLEEKSGTGEFKVNERAKTAPAGGKVPGHYDTLDEAIGRPVTQVDRSAVIVTRIDDPAKTTVVRLVLYESTGKEPKAFEVVMGTRREAEAMINVLKINVDQAWPK